MRPETLPLISDYKKEYKFLWCLSANSTEVSAVGEINPGEFTAAGTTSINNVIKWYTMTGGIDGWELYAAVVLNPIYSNYVSQLAQTVNLPDDEFEIENIPEGPVEYQMPKRVKLDDINVTYLEDSLESVYNFHKAWFNAIRSGRGMGINTPSWFTATACYIPFENTLTSEEYALFQTEFLQNMTSKLSSNHLIPSLPIGSKPTSVVKYPSIYPKRIHRTPANHNGTETATVEVTYARIPVFQKEETYLQNWNSITNEWENVDPWMILRM